MSPLDAMFLDVEDGDPHASMAIASFAVVRGPAPSADEFTAGIAGRLPLVPRYRQRAMRTPLNLGQPVWVDDPHFDLAYHARTTALPPPGDDAALCRLIGRIMSQRLDRARPLWEYWLVTGLGEDRWGVLSKVHHSMVDGVGGNSLYRLIFDESATPRPPVPDPWQPGPVPSAAELVVEAAGELARAQVTQIEQMTRAFLRPVELNRRVAGTTRGLVALAGSLLPVTSTSLTGPIGGSRRYGLARVPFADLRAVARAKQVTVNDVVLAAVTAAFRDLLMRRGEKPDPDAVRTMVPVSLRTADGANGLGNRVSMMLPTLPVDEPDPLRRLMLVHERLVTLKASHEAEASDALNAASAYEPFPLLSLAFRLAARVPQRSVMTVTTNVPGPATPLYLMGRPVLEILPYVPIAGRMRLGISVMTYGGQAVFGVTADYDSAPEVDVFAAAIAAGVAELVAQLPQPSPPPQAPPAVPRTRAPAGSGSPAPTARGRATRSSRTAAASTRTSATGRAAPARPTKATTLTGPTRRGRGSRPSQ